MLPEADVVVVMEIDVPWAPKRTGPNDDATVISIGVDPLYSRYPVRGYRSDLTLAGSPKPTLIALVDAVKSIGVDAAAAKKRVEQWGAAHDKRDEAVAGRAEAGKDQTPINKAYFSRELSKHLGEDTILLSELGVDTNQIDFTTPGMTFSGSPAGILGWAVGAALGAKLAAPEKTVVCTIGDGSYTFGVPSAGHIVSKVQKLPVLFIVWNNGIWNAVKNSAKNMNPDGVAAATDTWAFTELDQDCKYEMYCQASGGYGERVDDPAQVPAAIERALHAVRVEGRQALLNVIGA
jgi:acetolactate synthase-1/2/3 large subunit